MVRPAYTLGGTGGGLCDTEEQFVETVSNGLAVSPIGQVLVERSLAGWREIEYEVMRDAAGQLHHDLQHGEPRSHGGAHRGLHRGGAGADAHRPRVPDAAQRGHHVIRALEVPAAATFSSPWHPTPSTRHRGQPAGLAAPPWPQSDRYPIARLAAKIAPGRLDEIPNAVTGVTSGVRTGAGLLRRQDPALAVRQVPERTGARHAMKSTGEVMAIERSFEAAFNKALRSLKQRPPAEAEIRDPVLLDNPNDRRIFAVMEALRGGASVEEVSRRSTISVWFVDRLQALVQVEERLRTGLDDDTLATAKRMALSDRRIAGLAGVSPTEVADARRRLALTPTFKCVDTCAAEFAAATPYYYSTVESEDERPAPDGDAVVVLGSGPIRIGQGRCRCS